MVRSINVEPGNENNIKYLSKEIGKTPVIAVFYMPGCIHCEMLKEPWGNFKNSMIDNNEDTILAWVHKDVEHQLPDKIKKNITIQGYPTILGFDKKGGAKEFQKERNVSSLLNFYREITKGEIKGGSNGNSSSVTKKNRKKSNKNIGDMSTKLSKSSGDITKYADTFIMNQIKNKNKDVVSPITPVRGIDPNKGLRNTESIVTIPFPSLVPNVKNKRKRSNSDFSVAEQLINLSKGTKGNKGGNKKKSRRNKKGKKSKKKKTNKLRKL